MEFSDNKSKVICRVIWLIADVNCSISRIVAGCGIFFMFLLVAIDVTLRYLFKTSLLLGDEVAAYLLVLVTFIGLAYTLRADAHIKVEVVSRHLSQKTRKLADLATGLLSLMASSILCYRSFVMFIESYQMHRISVTYFETPQWIPQIFIPIGFLLVAVEITVELIKNAIDLKTNISSKGN